MSVCLLRVRPERFKQPSTTSIAVIVNSPRALSGENMRRKNLNRGCTATELFGKTALPRCWWNRDMGRKEHLHAWFESPLVSASILSLPDGILLGAIG